MQEYVRVIANTADSSNDVPSTGWTTEGKYVFWDENTGFTGNGWFQTVVTWGETINGPLHGMTNDDIRKYINNYGDLTQKFEEWHNDPTITDLDRSNWVNYLENKATACVTNVSV